MFSCGHCWDSPCTCDEDAPWREEERIEKARQQAAFDAMSITERLSSWSRTVMVEISPTNADKRSEKMANVLGAMLRHQDQQVVDELMKAQVSRG